MNNHISAKGVLGAFLLLFPLFSFAKDLDWFNWARKGELVNLKIHPAETTRLINSQDEKGYTAFILASYNNQIAYAKELLKLGADPCLTDKKGNNALMGVLFKGHSEMTDLLINKCDVNHRNHEGQTPLMYASLFGREKAVQELIQLGANRNIKDREGRDALGLAEGQWNQGMVMILKTFRIIR